MPVDDTNAPKNRRLALKALGGSAILGGLADKLPAAWQRPLVSSAVLPAHAQASPDTGPALVLRVVRSYRELPALIVPYRVDMRAGVPVGITMYPGSVETAALNSFRREQASHLLDGLLPEAHAQAAAQPHLRTTERNPVFVPVNGQTYLQLTDGEAPRPNFCNFLIRVTLVAETNTLRIFGGTGSGARGEGMPCGDFMIYPGQSPSGDSFINGYPILTEVPPGVGQVPLTTLPVGERPTIEWAQAAYQVLETFAAQAANGVAGITARFTVQPAGAVLHVPVHVQVGGNASYGTVLNNTGGQGIDFAVPGGPAAGQTPPRADLTAIQPAQVARGLALNVYADRNTQEGDETIVLTIEEREGFYVVGDQAVTTITIINDPSGMSATGGQIALVVMDTQDNQMVTLSLEYDITRSATNQIDQITFPVASVQMTAHQPVAQVLAALFPAAQAQLDGVLELTTAVVLDFSDGTLTRDANLDLSYAGTDCSSNFALTVTLYPGRQGIYEISGGAMLDCGRYMIEAAQGPGSGFGTFPPPAPETTPPNARVFRWIWEWGGYSVVGRLVTDGSGANPVTQNGDVVTGIFAHTYQVSTGGAVSQGGVLQYIINLRLGALENAAGMVEDLTAMLSSGYAYAPGDSAFTLTDGFNAGLTFSAGMVGLVFSPADGWQLYDENGVVMARAPAYVVPFIAEGETVPTYIAPTTTPEETLTTYWWSWSGLDPADNHTEWSLIGRFVAIARLGDTVTHANVAAHTYTAYRNGSEVFTFDLPEYEDTQDSAAALAAAQNAIRPDGLVKDPGEITGNAVTYEFSYIIGDPGFDVSSPTGNLGLSFYHDGNEGIGLQYNAAGATFRPNTWVFYFNNEPGRKVAARSTEAPVIGTAPPPAPEVIPATRSLPTLHAYWWQWQADGYTVIGNFTTRATGRVLDDDVVEHEFSVYDSSSLLYTLDLTSPGLTVSPPQAGTTAAPPPSASAVFHDFVYYADDPDRNDELAPNNEAQNPDRPADYISLLSVKGSGDAPGAGLRLTSAGTWELISAVDGTTELASSATAPRVYPYELFPPIFGTPVVMTTSASRPQVGWSVRTTGIPERAAGSGFDREENINQFALGLTFSPDGGSKSVHFRIVTDRNVRVGVPGSFTMDGRFDNHEPGDDFGLSGAALVEEDSRLYKTDSGDSLVLYVFPDAEIEPDEVVRFILDPDPMDAEAYVIDMDNRVFTLTIQDGPMPQMIGWAATRYEITELPPENLATLPGNSGYVEGVHYNQVTIRLNREGEEAANVPVEFHTQADAAGTTFGTAYGDGDNFVLSGVTAVLDEMGLAIDNRFILPADQDSFEVRVFPDLVPEQPETFSLILQPGIGYAITGSAQAQVYFTDPHPILGTMPAPTVTLSFYAEGSSINAARSNDEELVVQYDVAADYQTDGSPQISVDLGAEDVSVSDLAAFLLEVRLDDGGDGGAGTRERDITVNLDFPAADRNTYRSLNIPFGERVSLFSNTATTWPQRYVPLLLLTPSAAVRNNLPATRILTFSQNFPHIPGSPSRIRIEYVDSTGNWQWFWQFGNYRVEGTLTTLGRVPADFSLAQTAGSVTSAITQHGYAVFDRASQTELYTIDLVSGAYTIGEMRGTGGGQANINYRYLANQNTFDLGGDDGGFNATLLINSNTVGLRYDSTANTWDLLGMDGTELVSGAADIAGGPVFQGSHLPPAPIAAVRTFSWIWEAVARSGAMSGTRFRIRGTLVTAGPDDAVISHASRVVGLGGSRDTSTNLGLLVEHTFAVYTVADNGNENEHSTFNLLQPAHTLSGEDVTPVYSGFNDYNYAIGADAFTIEDPDTLWFTLRTDTSLTDSAPLVGLIDRGGSGGWDLFAGTTTTAGNALANFPETPGPLITEGPAPVPPQAFTRTFRWIWQAGGYQVIGRFVTNARDGEVLLHANTGADSSILEHTYEVLPTGGDALFRINLLTNEYTDLATDITTTLASFVNYTHTVGFPVFGERSSTFTYAFSLGGSQRGLASVSGTGWRVVDSSNTILANYEVQNITSSPYLYFALEPYIQEGDAVPAYPAHYQWTWNITLNSPLSGGTTPTPVTYYFNGIFASAQTGVITADNAYWNAYNVGTTLDENDTSNNVLVAVNLHPVPNPGSDTWSPSAQSATTFRSAATDVSNFSYAPGADGFTINSSQPLDLRVQRGENSIGLVINAADNTINLYADNGSLILDSLPFDSADAPVVTRINA